MDSAAFPHESAAIGLASLAILWLAVAYLATLGIAVLFRPAIARLFLSAFAATTKANVIECALRFIVGLAFIGASSRLKHPIIATGLGLFLAVTALILLLLPGLHRRFAETVTKRLFRVFPPFGLVSLALAALLLWFIL